MSEAARPGGTYQTLDEQRERLSPAEERFERLRQTIGLFLGPSSSSTGSRSRSRFP
jgi:sodium-dependent dicarboxylate transporter 2/3/5